MKLILGTLAALLLLGCDQTPSSSGPVTTSGSPGIGDGGPTGSGGAGGSANGSPDATSPDVRVPDATIPDETIPDGGLPDSGAMCSGDASCVELPDGGSCMAFDWGASLSVCSSDPLVMSRDDIEGTAVENCSPGCVLPWGCDDYDTARAQLAACVDGGAGNAPDWVIAAQGCGYLTLVSVPRDPYQGFYDPITKQLVATFTQDDLGHVTCSGTLPTDCAYGYLADPDLTNEQQLCGGSIPDSGADGG